MNLRDIVLTEKQTRGKTEGYQLVYIACDVISVTFSERHNYREAVKMDSQSASTLERDGCG